jgi:hypothetical protein
LVIVSYEAIAPTARAAALNEYDIYLKPLFPKILEKADLSKKLSKVSIGIIPTAKNPARTKAT